MDSRLLGAKGEHYAARYLRKQGYDILSGNFYIGPGELDIVAMKDEVLYFVEVKTRTVGAMLPPAEAVDYRKQENIKGSASAYINKYKLKEYSFYFDIIEVYADDEGEIIDLNHIKNAF